MNGKLGKSCAAIIFLCCIVGFHTETFGGQAEKRPLANYWIRADLSSYPILYIEEIIVKEPGMDEEDRNAIVEHASGRMVDYIENNILPNLFEDVRRGKADGKENAVIMRIELTSYDPISFGDKHVWSGTTIGFKTTLDFIARFIDAKSGEELAKIDTSTNAEWQKRLKENKDNPNIEGDPAFIEQEAARALAMYLALSKKQDIKDYHARLIEQQRQVADQVCQGPDWATIYIIRAQGFKCSGGCFSLGVNDTDLGVCLRKSYFEVKVRPGKHDLFILFCQNDKHLMIDAKGGESYFVKTACKFTRWELELFPPSTGQKKLSKCDLELVKILD